MAKVVITLSDIPGDPDDSIGVTTEFLPELVMSERSTAAQGIAVEFLAWLKEQHNG